MEPLVLDKAALRTQAFAARRGLDAETRQQWDRDLGSQLEEAGLLDAQVVMAFYPMPGEIDLRPVMNRLLKRGQTLLLPRCRKGEAWFEAVAVRDLENDLVQGPLRHLRDPRPDLPPWPREAQIDVVCVPGLAFDREGRRLGYGKGMYDRFLGSARYGQTVGLVVPCCLVERVPTSPHDLPVDRVLVARSLSETLQPKNR